jgi:tol-pal system protein YbgF
MKTPKAFGFLESVIIVMGISCLFLVGCSSSEEMTEEQPPPPVIDPMQKTIDSLQAENAALRSRLSRLEQEKSSLTAQVAELEMKVAESRTPPPPPPPMRTTDPRMEYDRALELFNQRNYEDALSIWMGLVNTGAPEGLESNCHYWIGECYYAMRQYSEAITHFQHVLEYAQTTKKDDAQLKIALCYEQMGDKARAKQEYQRLIDQYPVSPYVTRARERMGRL